LTETDILVAVGRILAAPGDITPTQADELYQANSLMESLTRVTDAK
jgi:hypothetical protein